MKKEYLSPEIKIVKVNLGVTLLAGSDPAARSFSIYDEEVDADDIL